MTGDAYWVKYDDNDTPQDARIVSMRTASSVGRKLREAGYTIVMKSEYERALRILQSSKRGSTE